MDAMKREFRRMDMGPGGYRCRCCRPAENKVEAHRTARRRMRREVENEIDEGVAEYKMADPYDVVEPMDEDDFDRGYVGRYGPLKQNAVFGHARAEVMTMTEEELYGRPDDSYLWDD